MDTNGRAFNDQVEATAFAGEMRTDISTIKDDLKDVRVDVKAMRSTQDRFLGVVAVASLAVPIIASVAMRMIWP